VGIGIGERAARVTVLILMLLLEELLIGLAILAILSNLTALLRVYHVYVDDGDVRVATCGASGHLTTLFTDVLCGMSFDSSGMKRGEFCHDRCVCLLLAACMQDVGAAEPDAEYHRMQCENARYKPCT